MALPTNRHGAMNDTSVDTISSNPFQSVCVCSRESLKFLIRHFVTVKGCFFMGPRQEKIPCMSHQANEDRNYPLPLLRGVDLGGIPRLFSQLISLNLRGTLSKQEIVKNTLYYQHCNHSSESTPNCFYSNRRCFGKKES